MAEQTKLKDNSFPIVYFWHYFGSGNIKKWSRNRLDNITIEIDGLFYQSIVFKTTLNFYVS